MTPEPAALTLVIDRESLRALVRAVVEETIAATRDAESALPDRLAFPEAEAARLIGLQPHQLRDARLDGKITASRITGRRVVYLRQDLLDYLARERLNEAS